MWWRSFCGSTAACRQARWALLRSNILWLLVVRAVLFVPFRLYEGLWRYTSLWDLRNIVGGVVSSTILFYVLVHLLVGRAVYPGSVLLVDTVLLVVLMSGVRLDAPCFYRVRSRTRWRRQTSVGFRAGDAGELIVRDMKNSRAYQYWPIGFIDDDVAKVGRTIHGVPVLGTRHALSKILERHRPDEVLIAILREFVGRPFHRARARAVQDPIKTLPNLRDIINGKVEVSQIRACRWKTC